ncbi:hypothetical protein Forpe1208_v000300 [Fusarium oxysporum f. sp. rapae]|uniref:Uncharacterized protein n=1 Tax=Fusarium oxysporum f. sp. rapae TaxID=485398 RepID=A0A8J5U4U2_FUSOX|nr:hypothetical protein Forpe1208_v000300 [Fusarium oxysporum f. sp. rapae]
MKYISYIIDPDGDIELLKQPNCQQLIPYVPSNEYDEEYDDPMNEPTVARPMLAVRYHVFDDLLSPAEAEGDLNPLGTIIYRSRFIAVAEESGIETPSTPKVFPNQETFDRATQTIIKHMDGRSQLSTDRLPIPGVLSNIDDKRQDLIGKIVTGLHDLLDTLPNSDFLCDWHKYESPTCSSIALGILKRELQRLASSDRPLAPPFNGYSVMSMIQLVNDMPESIAATTEEYDHYHDVSACSVRARMRRVLGDVKTEMNSWTLDLNMNVRGG